MNELKVFEHPKFGTIRTIVENGKTLFCGLDAANALGYKNQRDAITRHCRWVVKRDVGVQTGLKSDGSPSIQQIEMNFVTEGDLCRLAAKSELPGASEFESWIFDEVIPTILRTGSYSVQKPEPVKRPLLPEGVTLGSLVSYMKFISGNIRDRGGTADDIRDMIKETCEAVNFPVPTALTKQLPGQMDLFQRAGLEAAQ